jgi:uncharacterized protein (DUF1697 family)
MPKYVAFLRSINVGGKHIVKMEQFRALFATLKFTNVETFIASGNIIFETRREADERLERKIEKHLESELGFEVGTFVRSIEEVRAISEHQAFSKDQLKQAFAVYVGVMRKELTASELDQAASFKTDLDDFHVHGRDLYWLSRVPTHESKFPKKFEKLVKSEITYRNINTMTRLAAKYSH